MIWNILEHFSNLMTSAAAGVWREAFAMLPAWMKAIAVFLLVLTLGMSLMECWWGYKMNAGARFFAGLGSGVNVAFLIAALTVGTEDRKVLIWVLAAGAGCALVYCLLPRLYLAAGGVILGCTAAAAAGRFFPALEQGSRNGRILLAVLATAGGILAGIFAVKLGGVLHGLIGGALLGTILAGLIPLERISFLSNIPAMNQRLFRIILIGICAGTGALAQSLSLHAVRKREKMFGGSSTQAGEDRSSDPSGSSDDSAAARDSGPSATGSRADENRGGAGGLGQAEEGSRTGGIRRPGEAGSPAQAAGAGYGSTQGPAAQDSSGLDVFTRYELKNLDRCADVAEGLYSPEIAARKLGMPEQMFLEAMDQKGLRLPAEAGSAREGREQAEGSADSGQDPSASEKNGGTECTEKTADDTEQRKD